jgi:cation diffusion facilitator CzcD-associated flavoprotein CzcO
MSTGNLNKPKLPGIPGIKEFGGHSFHTSRWDYNYTGKNLENLADKNVALIGTGATGIQCAPRIAEHVKHFYLFQRTPSVVNERGNRPTDPEWVKTLTPGWQAQRRENFYALVSGLPQDVDLVKDGWTDIMTIVGSTLIGSQNSAATLSPEERELTLEIADAIKMTDVRKRVETLVESPKIADALKPWYRFLCKRPTFNDDFLSMFNRPNVTLVDTQGRGVDHITRTGLVFDGVEYPADCIVFATGFEVGTEFTRKTNLEIRGRDGVTLSSHWADDYQTLHGITSKGFPNLFFMGPNQGVGGGINFLFPAEIQANYIVKVLLEAGNRRARIIEPTEAGMKAWAAQFRADALKNEKFQQECTPGYFNNEGQPRTKKGFVTQRYGGGLTKFRNIIAKWQSEGMPGLEFK